MSFNFQNCFPTRPIFIPIPIPSPEDLTRWGKILGNVLYKARVHFKEEGRNFVRIRRMDEETETNEADGQDI